MENQEYSLEVPKPEQQKTKKRKLRTRKAWMENAEKLKDLTKLSPQEVIGVLKFLDGRANPFISEERRINEDITHALRDEKLRRMGLNPEDWTYFTSSQPTELKAGSIDVPFTEEDMARWNQRLPEGMELFVMQGEISPTSDIDRSRGREPFISIPHFWEIYTRIKPEAQLEAAQPRIEGPQDSTI